MIDLVYLASPSFSGSTLLTFLLNTHPSIATIGELKWGEIDLATYRCSCAALLTECPFWSRVRTQMADRGLPIDLFRPATDFRCGSGWSNKIARTRVRGAMFEYLRDAVVATLPEPRSTFPTVAAINRAMIEVILELQHARVFLDGSKDPVRLKYLLDTGDYNPWVIQLVRDGRGVMNSAMKNEGRTAAHAAREWRHTHEQIERLARRLPDARLLTVRYEDLCRAPGVEHTRILAFLGLSGETIVGDYRSVGHHILGNKMRLQASTGIQLDEKWRQSLSREDLAAFDRTAGDMNRRFGYV
ncbi:MAG: hypothetical protein HOP29_19985 [Phycisphaerales bacterium]|nr:hypothetical protein [Phycisphaerales bacterium]